MYKIIVSGALAVGLFAGTAAAQTTQLKYAFPATPKSPLMARGMVPWAKEVSAASGGTLNVKVFGGPVLGTFRNIYDRHRYCFRRAWSGRWTVSKDLSVGIALRVPKPCRGLFGALAAFRKGINCQRVQ